jgi:uncharacterized membrane protein YtjA (UPF0391 family)
MLRCALALALIAAVAGLLGFTDIAVGAEIAARAIASVVLGLVLLTIFLGPVVARKLGLADRAA